ncbi:glucose 1-dehydrogenase 1 [Plakobranchus ocellatus]|uniref:Glucose 1-dehydrogenase 1 n=1 Tax=Plakobranchus ocellatus TaxID=259542 RepID=A0AAV4C0I5_9GAST|nr:glucose 1-dehydrogenase 1 [Plakobranchus ocellatus]
MTDSAVREKALVDIHQAFGRLDVLVINHGVLSPILPFSDISEQDYDRIMDTNLKSAFFLIQKAVPYLEQSRGCVVCNSSLFSGLPGNPINPYYLSKAAMDHMVCCLALELGPKGLRCCCCCRLPLLLLIIIGIIILMVMMMIDNDYVDDDDDDD